MMIMLMKRWRNEGVEVKGYFDHSIPGKMSFLEDVTVVQPLLH